MAAAADIDTKELELCIKGLLISRPTVAKASWLQRECEEELGKSFPLRQLGFSTFVEYLKSIPNVVQVEPHSGYNPDVYPVASKASRHIDQLVSKQRVPPSKRRGVSRRGSYGFRPPVAPARRRPARPSSGTIPSIIRPNQGIDVRDLERDLRRNYDERDLTRNEIRGVDDLLSHAEGMVERDDSKVYPKLAGGIDNTDLRYRVNSIPAGLEEQLDDFDTDYEFYDEDGEKDSEEELSNKVISLWSHALKQKANSSSPSFSETEGNVVYNSIEGTLDQDEPEDDSNISRRMINNFRVILNKNLEGIWASELQKLYFEEFNVTLDFLDLGYTSAIALASSLPRVFSFRRVGSYDWKLYDARYITQESIDAQQNRGNNLSPENERYIPRTIIDKIKKLLEDNPNGFRSTDLLSKYQETFRKPLDLDVLGFNTLDEFLPILKNDITLKKVLNYYLLLPKHRIMPLEALEPPKPDDRLNIPAVALCVPVPENVMRLGDEIPLQELPPLQEDPEKPLMELVVRVAEVMSPVFFYMMLDSKHEELESMMDDLHKYYEWEGSSFQIPLPHFATNLYCAAKYNDKYWHRAKITRMRSDGDVEIEFIDYGTPVTIKTSELRYLSKEFSTLPVQAICAKLAGLKPLNGATKFPTEVCETFLNLVENKRLYAHVYSVKERMGRQHAQEKMQMELILYDVDNRAEEIVLNDYLVENGLASPILQAQDDIPEVELLVVNPLPVENLISPQASCPATPVPLCDTPYIQESGATSKMECVLSSVSVPRNETTLSPSLSSKEEKKPRRPPPGFEEIFPEPDFEISTPLPGASQTRLTNSESRPSTTYMTSTEPEHKFCINNYYLMNSKESYPELLCQEQFLPQNVYRPNPSNMPFVGTPLIQQSQQNRSGQSLVYGSFSQAPQVFNTHSNIYRQQEFQTLPPIPNNYFPPVPVPVPLPSNLLLPVSGNILLVNNSVPNPYLTIYPQVTQNLVDNTSSKVHNYRGNYPLNPPSANTFSPVQDRHTSSPSLNVAKVPNYRGNFPLIPPSANTGFSPVQDRHISSPSLNAANVKNYRGNFPLNPPSANTRFSPVQAGHIPAPTPNVAKEQNCGDFSLNPPSANTRFSPVQAGHIPAPTPNIAKEQNCGDFSLNPPSVNPRFSPVQAGLTPSPAPNAAKIQNCGGDFPLNPPSANPRSSPLQARHTPLPSLDATSTLSPVDVPVTPTRSSPPLSPTTVYTPITVPEWPLKNLPILYTNSFTETKIVPSFQHSVPASITSELSETAQIPRPSTPLTPGSTEVANICSRSIPNSTDLHDRNINSQNQMSSRDNSQINKSPDENSINNTQVNTCVNLSDNATSNFQSENDKSQTVSDSLLGEQIDRQQDIDVSSIVLPAVKELSQTTPSPEKLYSAISSPVEFLASTTPTKEESSDDYASACENVEEAQQNRISVLEPSGPFDESNKHIPDSWESLDLDETPSRTDNFPIDLSQPLESIIGRDIYKSNVRSSVPDVDKSTNSPLKSQISSLTIQPPVNWKDMFDPDTNSSAERFNNNNEVKENTLNLEKFVVKKIPVQKLEIQGKFFHLINVNNVPAVLPLEFFKQFGGINPKVAVKVIELHHNKFYNISKAEHPAVLSELNKVVEFCGGIEKKSVIRLNKANVINISEIPQCLVALNLSNKPLLEDLKKIVNEFKLF